MGWSASQQAARRAPGPYKEGRRKTNLFIWTSPPTTPPSLRTASVAKKFKLCLKRNIILTKLLGKLLSDQLKCWICWDHSASNGICNCVYLTGLLHFTLQWFVCLFDSTEGSVAWGDIWQWHNNSDYQQAGHRSAGVQGQPLLPLECRTAAGQTQKTHPKYCSPPHQKKTPNCDLLPKNLSKLFKPPQQKYHHIVIGHLDKIIIFLATPPKCHSHHFWPPLVTAQSSNKVSLGTLILYAYLLPHAQVIIITLFSSMLVIIGHFHRC